MNHTSMPASPLLTKAKNKSRRVLQVLQVSASDKDLLVSPNLMSGNGKKPEKSQRKVEVFKDEMLSKENSPVVPAVRRSKRKNAVVPEQAKKATSKEETETKTTSNKVSKVTKSKKASTRKSKKQNSVDPSQSKMDSYMASSSTLNTVLESNENGSSEIGMQSQQSKSPMDAVVCPNDVFASDASLQDSKDSGIGMSLNMLTSDNPPDTYWKLLAEERRMALEEALHENELLQDQLQVLETENSQLKGCLKEAEKLAMVLRQALD